MQTFFIDKEAVKGEALFLTGETAHHITAVLRIQIGETLRFSDGESFYYRGTVAEITKKAVKVTVTEVVPIDDEPQTAVILIQCLPRGEKMEQILQKTTELGVKGIIPVESEHSQVRLKEKKKEKQRRWQKIAAAAAEQCGRGIIPQVESACSLREAVAALPDGTALIFCYEKEENSSIRQTLMALKGKRQSVALIIGPEGGFSEAEASLLRAENAHSVSLGKRILRTETAGPAVLAVLMYEFGEWEVLD
ncbi:MAG TPA: 16S rRNA (uracil(1498)-N(3))-methyltransferase [Clostridiales bacterium]|nr:16S rRNA (uracil(1498)-N(3))-methyltransferase [Clostridiales bacterium]